MSGTLLRRIAQQRQAAAVTASSLQQLQQQQPQSPLSPTGDSLIPTLMMRKNEHQYASTDRSLTPTDRDGDPTTSYASLDTIEQDRIQPHHHHNQSNDSITSTVIIRVTPRDDHFVSWGVLWACFFLVSCLALYQIYRERVAARNASSSNHSHHHRLRHHDAPSSTDVENAVEAGGVSTADITRSMFRQLLLLAMIARLVLMPVQIWSNPVWWQFVGDTLPEMIFASAWTLLVSFFVQLVGIAAGTGTNTSPGIVIQATSYVVYVVLVVTQLWNSVASVLLYALLCCIYAALFGTVLYFCPRLLAILQPSLVRHGGLAARLSICTCLCILVFLAHTVGFALLVVAPPRKVYWWWNYGTLELLPSTVFLILMHPSSTLQQKADRRSSSPTPTEGDEPDHPSSATVASGGGASYSSATRKMGNIPRIDSQSSAASAGNNNNNAYSSANSNLLNRDIGGSNSNNTTPKDTSHSKRLSQGETTTLLLKSNAGNYGAMTGAPTGDTTNWDKRGAVA